MEKPHVTPKPKPKKQQVKNTINLKKRNSAALASAKKFTNADLKQIIHTLLKEAKAAGASSAEAGLRLGQGFSVIVRMGRPEYVYYNCGKDLGITVYFGHRSGTATTADLSKTSLRLALEKACYIAKYTSHNPCLGLAEAELMARNYPDLDLCHPWHISVDKALALAKKCEHAGLKYDHRIVNSEGVTVTTEQAFTIYGNTHGFLGSYSASLHNISCNFIAKEKNKMQRDGDYTLARASRLLTDVTTLGKSGAALAIRKLGARRNFTTRECPVIFEASIAKSIFSHFLSAINGPNLYNKMSFLCDSLGKQVLAKHISIDENPLIPQALGSSAFDQEGVATKQQPIVLDGKLVRYILGSYAARKLHMKTTGNAGGCYNILVTSENHVLTFAELLRTMKKGLLITELLGQGINLVTGDYSRGAFGFWVENGVIQYPVESITIAGNLRDMLLGIQVVGDDIDARGTITTGSVLIGKMNVAGGM